MEVTGSRVLLTGASGGLGQAIARAMSERGARVVVTGRRGDELEALAAEIGGEAVVADLAERADVDALPGRAGQVDILVHNAGLPGSGLLETYTLEQIDRVLDVNLRAGIVLTHALLPSMLERGRGHLVYVSSMSGKVPTPRASLYAATKFGLRGFAGALRDDLHGAPVGVTTIFPGPISEGGMWDNAGMKTPKGLPKRYPKDVAAAVVNGIERDRAEIDVADPLQRLGAVMAALAPQAAASARRLAGIDKIAEETASRQVDQR